MFRHKEQRVGIFVDVQNMYHSAKHLYGARVNFGRILETAVAGRKLIRAIAYVVKSKTIEEGMFFEALDNQGFEVKMKDLQVFLGGAKKADWDVGMAIDAVKLADRLDSIILVTGDGDFIPLITYLKENKGCQVEVMAFGESASGKLKEVADDFFDFSKLKSRFLIPVSRRRLRKKG
ncbi:MAG: hypothetical protein ACD_12C00642G0003 [uncultured bacterium]|nr:MAG: hypothetical protein ACD_12C00642G0003 [uncultured bacterium]